MTDTESTSRQVVFALTTTGDDVYARMQEIAAGTVRLHVSGGRLILVVDTQSHTQLRAKSPDLLVLFDEVRSIETPDGNPSWRNRWMKTGLRKYVSGDFLYLDADVVVRGDVSEIWSCVGDVGGVLNGNLAEPYFSSWEVQRYAQLGWSRPVHGSLNGGVLFWRDTPGARAVGKRYRDRWLEGFGRTGEHFDQQALNRAIDDVGAQVTIFDARFNAMETYHPRNLEHARIWHFMNSDRRPTRPGTKWHAALTANAPIPSATQWSSWRHPWIIRDPLAWLALQSMRRAQHVGFGDDWRRRWLHGERSGVVKDMVKLVLQRTLGLSAMRRPRPRWKQTEKGRRTLSKF